MTNYLFKNLNTLFLTCALVFISITNAQEVRVIDNKGTIYRLDITTAELFDTGGGLTITDADAIIQFNTQGIIDVNDYDVNTTSITIKKNGTYKVTYRVTAQITSGESRSGTEYRLLKTDEDGDISVVPGSYSAAYHRIVNRGKNTASASRILVLEKDDKLTVRGNRYAGNSTVKTVAHGSSFLVERMIK
tara:strand:+ start:544 stop:1113 length:570 start_codon:yes stop_codon:yes gene_type:complete